MTNMNAKKVLLRAVECDRVGRILEAQIMYQDGIQMLMDLVRDEVDVNKKQVFYERIKEYIDRAEQIKERLNNQATHSELVTNIQIEEDSEGNSYKTLLGKYMDQKVMEVLLEEPYLHERHHFHNLIVFLELLKKNCSNLKYIRIITKRDPKMPENQDSKFNQIKSDLTNRDVTMSIKYDEALHDRKIVLSNGYIIKIGRGLDFFKPTNPMFSLGLLDFDFRKCKRTEIDIWFSSDIAARRDD